MQPPTITISVKDFEDMQACKANEQCMEMYISELEQRMMNTEALLQNRNDNFINSKCLKGTHRYQLSQC